MFNFLKNNLQKYHGKIKQFGSSLGWLDDLSCQVWVHTRDRVNHYSTTFLSLRCGLFFYICAHIQVLLRPYFIMEANTMNPD